jgi:mRNA interferase RelE/StbE
LAYAVEVTREPRRFLERLANASFKDFLRIDAAIRDLARTPRPPGAKKMRARGPLFRIRVGDYRIMYAVFDPDRLVKVEDVFRRTSTSYKDR